ncbi:unnamed protein product [Cylindrotheca closterium]|uniref:Phytanoyl-CoA dioxygenase n=1 Tax=Cylindrotheca closterium TaxID=2856 RepID=A0AAD2JJA9_9STRA|nr:unnamed protein product [Cylindrotheca closterium]
MLFSLLIVLHLCFVLLWSACGYLVYIRDVAGPQLHFPYKASKESTLEYCGPTTDNFEDLIVSEDMGLDKAEEQTDEHGLAVVRNILSGKTASNLRDYILRANHKIESTFVLSGQNRYHIMPTHEEPAIQAALKEIGTHPVMKPLIDRMLGPKSSLVAFSVITNLYGAQDQIWHYDTGTSHASYPDYFVPEYTLAIPLQDTTKEMGATGICPGTHKCSWPDVDWEDLEEEYNSDPTAQGVYGSFDQWTRYHLPCDLAVNVTAGDGMLYNADVYHRGSGHKDPNAPERVVAFLTFAGSRQSPQDHRSLPLGTVHSLDWRSWGHTIDDFATVDTKPWRLWHPFGLFNPCRAHGIRPWTVLDYFFMIFRHSNEAMHMISADFDEEYFEELVYDTIWQVSCASIVYLGIVPFIWIWLFLQLSRKVQRLQVVKIKQS